eukprot:CAMPEP_0174871486 /NCGR_PEP_ID=MMETSP1114-20130205/71617_1 /TAXON_ID=312471 /ORGANISM="Neobodo designis, Strain CCAP 1951/1" /LENGTH=76 /DNA_ID=CAMNT_0016106769 /DNA_START=35 /DNA_END=262 /DNA_ORIENTATION=+
MPGFPVLGANGRTVGVELAANLPRCAIDVLTAAGVMASAPREVRRGVEFAIHYGAVRVDGLSVVGAPAVQEKDPRV